ncbi:MAG TPA: TIGR04283 family arsenosugar biosynthesis glycosyltransferase [Ktedonobacteraceae bacterium]|nr:TIGR04283 family arsenosugar biosynthesis glycosyltransferase [Ktedonobacteraceae bacterium]
MHFSIIMPVLNEEAVLEHHLSILAGQIKRYSCELLIVDGGSTDQTVDIAQHFGRVISSQRGRAAQMNSGALAASGETLLFLHADTLLPDDAFDAIERALKTQDVVGGAFRICFNCDQWPYHLAAFVTNLRSRFGKVFTGDQAYFVRSTCFHAIGGFPDQPLMEDLEIIHRLRKIGKVILLPQYVTTSARRHEKIGLIRTVLFMWYLRTLYRFGTSPVKLHRMYFDVR